MKLENGEIAMVNLTLLGKKQYLVKDVIFSQPYEYTRTELKITSLDDRRILNKFKIKEDCRILKIEVIKKLGKKHKSKSYSEVVKSDDSRNKITGTYE